MNRPVVVAIDGPAGAGKSTVGELLADRLGFFYFDTGALYRSATLAALDAGIDPSDETALTRLAEELDVSIGPASVSDGRQYDVTINGRDCSQEIRSPRVDRAVSPVSASPGVRAALVEAQRRQVRAPGTVMVGRDIGTVICPNADLKVYLDASAEERARRRKRQTGASGEAELAAILATIRERDRIDSTRSVAPLTRADDAVAVDTDGLSIAEVVDHICRLLVVRGLVEDGCG